MELWIRSQDKTKLLKCNLIETMDFYTKKQKSENYMPKNSTSYSDIETITTYVNDKYINSKIYINNVEFATYKTKERALEVLDEIQDKMLNSAFAKKINGLGEELDLIPNPILIYNMPEN